MRFWNELKRRNVVRVAALYIVASWALVFVGLQIRENTEETRAASRSLPGPRNWPCFLHRSAGA
jgi:hypothetical protein